MPHITIQMYPGRSDELKKKLAEALREAASRTLEREEAHFSVSVKDVPKEKWKEQVYDKVRSDANTVIQPGYTM